MKHRFAPRVLALAAVTSLLFSFALPAAAAPGNAVLFDVTWTSSPLVQWVLSFWPSGLGTVGQTGGDAGPETVRASLNNALDPDGNKASVAGTTPDDGEGLLTTEDPWGTLELE